MSIIAIVFLSIVGAIVARISYLYCYYLLHPANVPDSSRLPPYKQHEVVTENVKFLRGKGTHGGGIAEPGWARQLVYSYQRSQAKLWAPLVKEWDYYACLDDEFVFVS